MNKPNRENYEKKELTLTIKGYDVSNYIFDLEAYCRFLEKENIKLEKALDKACTELHYKDLVEEKPIFMQQYTVWSVEEWKEWSMK